MPVAQARVRMFAGPNGSGKSTIRALLRDEWIGVYVNADDIESTLRAQGRLELSDYLDLDAPATPAWQDRLRQHLQNSSLLHTAGLTDTAAHLQIDGMRITWPAPWLNSYLASALASWIRQELLQQGVSFTFETVMSSADKVEFLKDAQARGFRTYLYFVATEDPQINLDRVAQRVAEGGHDVPADKVVQRYARSIALLDPACSAASRAYIFDNSGDAHRMIAEVTDGHTLTLHTDTLPRWFTQSSLWASFQP